MDKSTNNTFERHLGSQLSSKERQEALEGLFVFGRKNQRPFLIRMAVLLVISTVIASCGLLSDSAAVVIGAMLVAPLMRPVMAAAAAITLGWTKRLYTSLLLTCCMAIAAVIIAACITLIAPHMITIPIQVIARTKPTFFDLVIALAAGAGGAYVMTRKESSSIPGVAMAVALLPPLASCGILFVFKEHSLALKAFVLFFTNFVAMVMAGSLTFIVVGISPASTLKSSARLIRNSLITFALLVVIISIPLYFYSTEVWYDAEYKANQSEELQAWLSENKLTIDNVEINYEKRVLYMQLLGPQPPLNIETLYNELMKKRESVSGKNVAPFRIDVGWTQQTRLSWPPVPGKEQEERQLKKNYSQEIRKAKWYWIGTQYADGKWLKPQKENIYFFHVTDERNFTATTFCKKRIGNYKLHQENISFKINATVEGTCTETNIDARFIDDLQQVVNLDLVDDRLSLRISNGNGVMYFKEK